MAVADLAPWVAQLGAIGIVAWMVFTGRLIPRRVHEQAMAAEKRRADDWREAYQAEAARGDVRDQQFAEILSFVRRPREAA